MTALTALLGRAADSIREHGATPGQAAAMAEICRICDRPGKPASLRLAARGLAKLSTAAIGDDSQHGAYTTCTYPWCEETGPHDEGIHHENAAAGGIQ